MLRAQLSLFSLFSIAAAATFAQGNLENPADLSSQSGVGIVSGWFCDATNIEVVFDERPALTAAYGTDRLDTEAACGDSNNGFGLLWNFNLLGAGDHRVRVYADGVQFADQTFSVGMLGAETFINDLSGTFQLNDFPQTDAITTVEWGESMQNFTIVESVVLDPALKKWNMSDPAALAVSATLVAESPSTYFGANPPELVIACVAGAIDISVQWNEQLNTINDFTRLTAATDMFMFQGSDTVSSLVPDHLLNSLINSLQANRYLTANMLNAAGDALHATFDVRGFDQAYLQVDTACI